MLESKPSGLYQVALAVNDLLKSIKSEFIAKYFS